MSIIDNKSGGANDDSDKIPQISLYCGTIELPDEEGTFATFQRGRKSGKRYICGAYIELTPEQRREAELYLRAIDTLPELLAAAKAGLEMLHVPWDAWDAKLGTVADRAIAERIGLTIAAVQHRRIRLGIPPFRRHCK